MLLADLLSRSRSRSTDCRSRSTAQFALFLSVMAMITQQCAGEVDADAASDDLHVRTITPTSAISVNTSRCVSRVDPEPPKSYFKNEALAPVHGLPEYPGGREELDPSLASIAVIELNGKPVDPNSPFTGQADGKLLNGCLLVWPSSLVGGRLEGDGQIEWPDGLVYKGQFSKNTISGEGIYTWPNGSQYTGQLECGKRHGTGVYVHEGCLYQGEWNYGQRHGYGTMRYLNGAQYEGEWKADARCGTGQITYASGNTYAGQWESDVRHGNGKMIWTAKEEEYSGEWRLGTMHGEGSYFWLNTGKTIDKKGVPNMYCGGFKNGQMHGNGRFTYSNGAIYNGQFVDGEKDGEGEYVLNKRTIKACFKQNRMYDPETGEGIILGREERRETKKHLDFSSFLKAGTPASVGRKISDLAHRMRFELNAIFRYYCALGTSKVEEMYAMTANQWIRLCKDCSLASEHVPVPVLAAMHSECCGLARTSSLPLKDYYQLLVRVGLKRCPLEPDEYRKVKTFLNDNVVAHASMTPADEAFRVLLYTNKVQQVLSTYKLDLECIFHFYAQQFVDVEDFNSLKTLNMEEYLMFLRDVKLCRSPEEDPEEQTAAHQQNVSKAATKSQVTGAKGPMGRSSGADRPRNAHDKLRHTTTTQRRPCPMFSISEAFKTFTAPNIDSDWESSASGEYWNLDTEMVFMEFIEGLARLAYVAYQKQQGSRTKQSADQMDANCERLDSRLSRPDMVADEDGYSCYFEGFLGYICKAFPHRLKYLEVLSGDQPPPLGSGGFQSR